MLDSRFLVSPPLAIGIFKGRPARQWQFSANPIYMEKTFALTLTCQCLADLAVFVWRMCY